MIREEERITQRGERRERKEKKHYKNEGNR